MVSQTSAREKPPVSELEQLREKNETLQAQQQEIMQLLEETRPERVVHALRNVLNERALLRAMRDMKNDAE